MTIEYFAESSSNDRAAEDKSLRFPRLKTVWEDGKRFDTQLAADPAPDANEEGSKPVDKDVNLEIIPQVEGSPSQPKLLPVAYHLFPIPLPYDIGLKLQQDILDVRLADKARYLTLVSEGKSPERIGPAFQDVMLLLEHTPTYTTGRRDNPPPGQEHILHPEEKKVQNVGAGFHVTKRGGQVTYHGPGQLVGYGIFDLNKDAVGMDVSVSFLCQLTPGNR